MIGKLAKHTENDASKSEGCATFAKVREDELKYLLNSRHHSKKTQRDLDERLIGLALSGGGIRSATTNLGLLQALSKMDILPLVDYLSTVSGGGYIGACMSSLLSINGRCVPDKPGQRPCFDPEEAYLFEGSDRPQFSTRAHEFPFRAEPYDAKGLPDVNGSLASELVGHLRTHGNFLIARRGVLKRDTMRAIGNLITGVVYNLAGFGLLLFFVSALYLTVAMYRTGDLTTAFEIESGATTLQQRIRNNVERVVSPAIGAVSSGTWTAPTIRLNVWAVRNGALYSLAMLVWIGMATAMYRRRVFLKSVEPKAGESEEDVLDRRILQVAATLGFVLLAAMWFVPLPVHGVNQGSQWLLIPFVVLLSARVSNLVIAVVLPTLRAKWWTRRARSLWGGFQAITIYGLWITGVFAFIVPLIVAVATTPGKQLIVGLGGVGSMIATRLLTVRRSPGRAARIPRALLHMLLGAAVFLVVVLGIVFFGALIADHTPIFELTPLRSQLSLALLAILLLLFLGYMVDHNKVSPHYFYRDRLSETYLFSEIVDTKRRMWAYRDAMEMQLHRLHGDRKAPPAKAKLDADPANRATQEDEWRNSAPYHLISAAINLAGSRDLTRKDRKSGYWLFSKLYCGSVHTGFRRTKEYRGGETKLARAVTISGAAASSAMGFYTFFAQSFATVLFNVRLGHWIENPSRERSVRWQEGWIFWPYYLKKEVLMDTTEHDALVNLSDGGHTGDNVGIYPLLQRRCKIIIACDAEADAQLSFGSFTEALRHAYIDEAISVDIDLSMIRPDPDTGLSRSHCAVGRIRYPDRPWQTSYLIYIKSSLTGDEPEPMLNYRAEFPAFPHERTVDQFFSDAQFESYRALGVHLAETSFSRWIKDERQNLWAMHGQDVNA